MKFRLFVLALCVVLTSTLTACASQISQPAQPKNIIYLIGDGMGIAHTTAYRYYKASKESLATGDKTTIAQTVFDKHLVGMASTYPADDTLVTDSAAGATALSTGFKSYNGAIGVTPDQQPKETLLEKAKKLGWTTGVVSTSQINHATPASFIAHIDSRRKYEEIADQYLDIKIQDELKADIMLGGGTRYFERESRNLVGEFKALGGHYVNELSQLEQLTELPALGLFGEKGLSFEVDSAENPKRLTQMARAALRLVKGEEKPFFLMIEGSQIDWCSHANDIACALKEMEDFENTLAEVIEFAKRDGNTIVVVTADHSTGGLSLGRDKKYAWQADLVHKVRISSELFSLKVLEGADSAALWRENVDLPITEDEIFMLNAAQQDGKARDIQSVFNMLVSQKTLTGWTTTGHTAEDVQVFAFGPGYERFIGFQDNTDIAKKLFEVMGE